MNQIKVKYVNLPLQFNSLKEEINSRISIVLETGNFVLGKELQEFERDFALLCETKYAIGVANGTDAIVLSLKALGIKEGDEVITVPNSFIATAGAIGLIGAKPVFVDVREDFNINPDLIENAITEKTKAILPVHLTGKPAEMNKIMEIAKKHNLFVVEDAAQAVGATYFGKKIGSFGDTGCFSLHPLKNLNAGGDAGAITTNNKELYEKLLKLRNHGLKNRNESEFWGYNSRLDCIQAAVVNVKMKYLKIWEKRILEISKRYQEGLKEVVKVPKDEDFKYSVYHTFIVQCDNRDKLQEYLLERGIESKIHYPLPIHLHQCASYLGYKEGDFPVTEDQAKKILSLPIYPELTNEQIDLVIAEIKGFYYNNNNNIDAIN